MGYDDRGFSNLTTLEHSEASFHYSQVDAMA